MAEVTGSSPVSPTRTAKTLNSAKTQKENVLGQAKTIKEQIELLIGLQVIDREIYALTSEKKGMPVRIKAIDQALENKKSGI